MKQKYYSLKNILSYNAHYNVIFGERSNGKTYSVLQYAVQNHKTLAYIRRYREDFRGKRGQALFAGLAANGEIEKWTNHVWTDVFYYASKFYFCRYDPEDGKRIVDEKPMAYAFALTETEHDKGASYPDIDVVCFDEFLTRDLYLADEFVLFMNTLSTIIRGRNNVKIFMLGNTVNKYSPYFSEMGLKHIKDMKQGTIDVYTYGQTDLKVAVEYADTGAKSGKSSDVYFAFDSPELKMITTGAWELSIYPHLPEKYKPKDVLFVFFIIFDGDTLQCEIVSGKDGVFIFVHRKTTPIQDETSDLVFTTEYSHRPNYRRKLTRPVLPVEKKIAALFATDKVFYQSNEIGEIVRNYLEWCRRD